MLDCYMSPKAMWEGIMSHAQPQQLNTEIQHQEERIQVAPFLVSNRLNDRDLQLIHYVFDISWLVLYVQPYFLINVYIYMFLFLHSLNHAYTYLFSRTSTIFSSSRFFLSQSEFTTLKPRTLLDSSVSIHL